MRDGVRLGANMFRPGTTGRFPAILVRTPYNKGDAITPNYQSFVNHGYAVVVQDVRGRYESDGEFEPLNQEVERRRRHAELDRAPALVGRRSRNDRRLLPRHRAMEGRAGAQSAPEGDFPVVSGDDDYRDRFYSPGGAMKLGHRLLWLADNMRARGFVPPDFKTYVAHAARAARRILPPPGRLLGDMECRGRPSRL